MIPITTGYKWYLGTLQHDWNLIKRSRFEYHSKVLRNLRAGNLVNLFQKKGEAVVDGECYTQSPIHSKPMYKVQE